MARTNIAVDDVIAARLADEATRANKTLYAFSNECIEAVLKIFHDRGSADEIYPFWLQTKMSKELDGMPWLNRGLLDSLVKTFYPANSDTLLKIFFQYGVVLGSYVRLRASNFEDLLSLIKLFGSSIPARVFEMERIDDQSEKRYVFRYVSGISDDTTVCVGKYMEGLFSCYSSSIQSKTSTAGVVEMEIKVI
ncbi:MAG: hypothetical protein OK439_04460 [Thaumarchaeota archaeon]|nr:hypothetical protein [Nitrososphaerota archaeon]